MNTDLYHIPDSQDVCHDGTISISTPISVSDPKILQRENPYTIPLEEICHQPHPPAILEAYKKGTPCSKGKHDVCTVGETGIGYTKAHCRTCDTDLSRGFHERVFKHCPTQPIPSYLKRRQRR